MFAPHDLNALVVDDDELSRTALSEFLAGLGIARVERAASCAQALDCLARTDDIDFIVLDIYLPDMDGIEFMGKLKQTNFFGGLVLVSGDPYILKMSRTYATTAGLDVWGALVKPVSPPLLSKILEDNRPPDR